MEVMIGTNLFFHRGHLGVSVAGNTLHAVELNAHNKLVAKSEVVVQQPFFGVNHIEAGAVIEGLKALMSQQKFSSTLVAVTLPEKFAYSREYHLPKLAEAEIAEAITWQIEKIFPFSAHEVYFDWKLLERTNEATRVLVVAMQRKWIDELRNAFISAGLTPVSFEPSASAISRLVAPEKAQLLILLEVDRQGGTATLVIEGISTVTTTAMFNGKQFQDSIPELIASIQSLIHHLDQRKLDRSGLEVIVAGELASPELATLLQQHLQVATTVLQPEGVEPAYQLAYAAAKGEVHPPESNKTINILPQSLVEHYRAREAYTWSKRTGVLLIGLVIPMLLVSLLAFFVSNLKAGQLQQAVLQAKQAQAVQVPLPQMVEDNVNVPLINRVSQRFTNLFPQKATPQEPINVVLGLIPPEIAVVNLSYEQETHSFHLTGIAATRDDLFAFRKQLEESGRFSQIVLPLSSLAGTQQVEFTLEFLTEKK